ncbi:BMC_2a_G0012740.mRNA.1.CDS.1 [Saccharomyces cerevisiae]|nr:BMC_2a_G0012740.mRNA.1.CDS.1 [Saccharomyces cerevisiae]CAI4374559.1 BMB_G0012710.mRNA.1.CDS.1 [Saccharomyces cerevisiae]CAI7082327.1 BMC_2a_G0012740.mRNA.1.CDS.1 [Saccharomyces cerevisiae]CAI7083791.1 BMB_G0012710.mRNA.1.CDS.1 [Saccharomyces cerevisiae]
MPRLTVGTKNMLYPLQKTLAVGSCKPEQVPIRSLASVVESSSKILDKSGSDREVDINVSEKIYKWTKAGIEQGKEHFKVGGNKVYFPKARIILLRPNAKHTPYQAKFIVPKSFNKLDLRDYLYHIYGLRAMNITTQLLHGKFNRMNLQTTRFREPQIKKMTIEMEEPFIWPEEPRPDENSFWDSTTPDNMEKYREERLNCLGSDANKPGTAFDGVVGPYERVAQPFIPRFLKREIDNKRERHAAELQCADKLIALNRYIEDLH